MRNCPKEGEVHATIANQERGAQIQKHTLLHATKKAKERGFDKYGKEKPNNFFFVDE